MGGYRLHKDVVARSSQLMLRSFLLSLFAGVDVTLREKQLYCDVLCEHGPVVAGKQVSSKCYNVLFFFCLCMIEYSVLDLMYVQKPTEASSQLSLIRHQKIKAK